MILNEYSFSKPGISLRVGSLESGVRSQRTEVYKVFLFLTPDSGLQTPDSGL
jgi:hypothetical protein